MNPAPRPLRLGVLLSGTGRTFDNFLRERAAGRLPVDPVCVISSRPGVRGLELARSAGVPSAVVPPRGLTPEALGGRLADALLAARVELVAMAGYLHLWSIPRELHDRVMNVHPALLPAFGGKGFYGERVHRAVLAAGVKVTGCTVHFADNEYDHGPILVQRAVAVDPEDDVDRLARKVFAEECIAYPEAIRLFAAGRFERRGDVVRVLSADRGAAPE